MLEPQQTILIIILVQHHLTRQEYFHLVVHCLLMHLVMNNKYLYMDHKSWLSYMKVQVKKFVWVLMVLPIVTVGVLKEGLLGYHQNIKVMPERKSVSVGRLREKMRTLNLHRTTQQNRQRELLEKVRY